MASCRWANLSVMFPNEGRGEETVNGLNNHIQNKDGILFFWQIKLCDFLFSDFHFLYKAIDFFFFAGTDKLMQTRESSENAEFQEGYLSLRERPRCLWWH